jgi:hypothetical protein
VGETTNPQQTYDPTYTNFLFLHSRRRCHPAVTLGAGVPTTLPKRGSGGYRHRWAPVGSEQRLLGASLFVTVVFCVVMSVFPPPLVLPAWGLIIMLSGVMVGIYAQVASRLHNRSATGLEDIAGVLCLFGFAALILCDRTEVLQNLAVLTGP